MDTSLTDSAIDSFPFCQFPKRLEMAAAAAARGKVGWDQYRTSSEAAAAAGCHYAPIEEKLRDQKKNFLNSNEVRAQLEALKKYSLVIVKKKRYKKGVTLSTKEELVLEAK
jgi:hypothetical protein